MTALTALATQLNTSMQRAIRDQRNYVEALAEQAIRDGHVHGFIDLPSGGEVLATVSFPIAFIEKPIFTYGLELGSNTGFSQGSFPIHSATVGSWVTQRPADSVLYIGATIGIVTIDTPRCILHYSFEGQTITVPVGTEMNVSAPL